MVILWGVMGFNGDLMAILVGIYDDLGGSYKSP